MTAQIIVNGTGVKVPSAEEIKTAIQGVFTSAFGTDLSLDESTPQGVLIDGITQQKELDNSQILYLFNQFSPETASGVFQNAIASIYFLQRKVATHSIVNCVCSGLAGTVLNGVSSGNPAMAQSTNGDLFQCLTGGTIPASGSIILAFSAVETGPITVASNTVNKIYSAISGWDSINNPTGGVIGAEEESRANFAQRIKNSLAINATGSLSSVLAHVFACDGVTHVKVEENDTDGVVTKGGITLNPHSVYICEYGATDTDELAEAIYNSKSAGCDTNGPNTCTYLEPATGVSYSYKYYTPTTQAIYIKISTTVALSVATQQTVKEALLANFNGEDNSGETAITIGTTFYASRFYKAISNMNNSIVLNNIKISTDGINWEDSLSFNMNILPILDIISDDPEYVLFEVA